MATIILRPNGAGDVTGLTPDPAVDNYLNVDEAEADDDTTDNGISYEGPGSADEYDLYALENSSDLGTINSVTVYARSYLMAGGAGFAGYSGYTKIKTGGTEYEGEVNTTGGWTTYNTEYTTNPKTSSAWTWDEVNSLQAGVRITGGGESGGGTKATQVYVEVDYEAGASTYTKSVSVTFGGS